jgi:hypothetical protein
MKVLKRQIEKILKPIVPDSRTLPQTKIALRQLYHYYADRAHSGIPLNISDTGARIFSQFEEDGILLAIFATIGAKTRKFIDIGAGDGIDSNCANLALNFGWDGLFIDGNPVNISKGREFYNNHPDTWAYSPRFVEAMVTRENINDLILKADFSGEIDLLSIDIDGNDYWIWDAITCIEPKVVIIETHIEFGLKSIVVPYEAAYHYPGKHPQYHGASPVAMKKLAEKKGYRLVGSNNYGFNTIYIFKDLYEDLIPAIPVKQVLNHPRNAERMKLFDEIKNWEYIQV